MRPLSDPRARRVSCLGGRIAWRPRCRLVALIGATVLLAGLAIATPVSAFVYWANFADGTGTTIGRANTDGTGTAQDFISDATDPIGLAVDRHYIYWANAGTNSIGRANLDGDFPNPDFIAGAKDPYGVAVDGTHVYWANLGSDTIGRANLDGSDADESFVTGASVPEGVAVDGQHIYWANAFNHAIGRANLDGTGVNQAFINDAGSPAGVAVDTQHIYWTDNLRGAIGRANIDGSHVDTRFISGGSDPIGIAVDAQHIYWTNASADQLGRANLDGSAVEQNFTSATDPYGVAVDVPARATTATTVACSPATLVLTATTSCTVTVTDIAGSPQAPGGTVALTASRAGSFTPGDGCALDASSSSEPTCQLTFLPRAIGPVTISAAYSGDPAHAASGGSTSLSVTAQLLGPVRPTRATISALRQTNARFAVASASTPLTALAARAHPPRGTVFSFRVDQPAVVKIAIQQHVGGRQVGHRCLAPARKLRRHRQCIRMITLATLTRGAREGSNRVSFTGRIAKRALPPGRYQARFTAIDSAGVSPPRTLRFTIVR